MVQARLMIPRQLLLFAAAWGFADDVRVQDGAPVTQFARLVYQHENATTMAYDILTLCGGSPKIELS